MDSHRTRGNILRVKKRVRMVVRQRKGLSLSGDRMGLSPYKDRDNRIGALCLNRVGYVKHLPVPRQTNPPVKLCECSATDTFTGNKKHFCFFLYFSFKM